MKFDWKRTFFVGLAFFGISAFWQGYDLYVSLTLEGIFGFDNTKRGVVMALDNIFALFLLPLFGKLSDRTKSRYGKRTPYIIAGTVVAAVAFIFVAHTSDSALRALIAGQDAMPYLPSFIAALLVALLAMSVYRSPAVALMPDVTPKPLRSKANAVINLMGGLGGISVMLLGIMFYKETFTRSGSDVAVGPIIPVLSGISGVMLISLAIFAMFVREPKLVTQMKAESVRYNIAEEEPAGEKQTSKLPRAVLPSMLLLLSAVFLWFMGYNAVTSSFSVYAKDIWGLEGGNMNLPLLVAHGAAMVMFIPIGFIASKIGRKKTILAGIIIIGAAFGGSFFFRDSFSPLILVFFALAGIGWATINVNSFPMVVEMSRSSSIGVFTGYYYTASMAAQIVTPILSGVVMDKLGRISLFPYAIVFVALSFVAMLFVMHGDSKAAMPKDKLELYDVED